MELETHKSHYDFQFYEQQITLDFDLNTAVRITYCQHWVITVVITSFTKNKKENKKEKNLFILIFKKD